MVLEAPDMETATAAPLAALVRFGRWSEALAQPAPRDGLLFTTGVWRHARGLAFLATNRRAEAEGELAALRALAARVPAERTLAGFFKTRDVLRLAVNVLAGEIAGRGGDTETAARLLREAVQIQDRHWFTEPPPWYFPVRQTLGAVLLAGGRAAEAETVYREDLRRNPENGWSLFGLAQSLRAQGKGTEAAAVDGRFRRAWAQADVTLTASRF
jgi:tetratricopeptide (TPR) repeat protein